MKLSDVVGASGLSMYAIVALLLFVGAFVVVLVLTFRPGAKARHERDARLPLEDGDDEKKHNGPAPRAGE